MARIPITTETEQRIRETARHRCGYCLSQQQYVMAKLIIEHIIPRSSFASNDAQMHAEENLWLACNICNGHKSDKTHAIDLETGVLVPLFNPRTQRWNDHFEWANDGIQINGITPTGRATVIALHLNSDPEALPVRANWVNVGWHPPKD